MRAKLLQSAVLRTNVKHRPAPSLFYFPGLDSKSLWDAQHFEAHSRLLRDNYETILSEYKLVQSNRSSDYGVEEHKLHRGNWDWHSYVAKGIRQPDFALQCPKTADILERFDRPRLMTGTPFSFSFFSTMHPKSKIEAHCAPCNLRVRCHFPIIVPSSKDTEECGMRVGDEVFQWEVGMPIYFDDAFEHEVWNKTDEHRVVLLFDLWHPDLTAEEIGAIEEMFGEARSKGWLK